MINRNSCNAQPEIGTDGSTQTRQNPQVGGYGSGTTLTHSCVLTWSAGRLPSPVSNTSQYLLGTVLSQGYDMADHGQSYCSHILHNADAGYPAYNWELLAIWDTTLYWTFDLHWAKLVFLVHTNLANLGWILTQSHLTFSHMNILTVLQQCDWEVKSIQGVKDSVAEAWSHHLNFRWEWWELVTLEAVLPGKWSDDIKVHIIDNESFRPIAHCLAISGLHS